MLVDLFDLYNSTNKLNVNIIYSGPIWGDGVEGISGIIRKRLEFDEASMNASQAVFSVFVEQMHSVLEYTATSPKGVDDEPNGVLILGVRGKTYFTQSGYIINDYDAKELKASIDYINSLDKQELRRYYTEQLKSEGKQCSSISKSGLIEIAKRTTSKIDYGFEPLAEGLSFFSMYAEIEQRRK